MNLAWLLPVVTLVVGASTGGAIAPALMPYSPQAALLTVTFSACMVIIGLALTMMLLPIYLLRNLIYGYPKGPTILSAFFPLGPAGQGAYAILLVGSGFKSMLPPSYGEAEGVLRSPITGETIEVICIVTAFALWVFGTMWMVFAFVSLWHSLRQGPIPFRLTFWSMIFPNVCTSVYSSDVRASNHWRLQGVYANCTLALATTFSSTFFRTWGTIYAVGTLLLWISIAVQTVRMITSGRIFDAPSLEAGIGRSVGVRVSDEEKA
jgi:tellurite resistance protein TehA-like permease